MITNKDHMTNDLNVFKLRVHGVREDFKKHGDWEELEKELKLLKRDVYYMQKASKQWRK